MTEKSQIKIYIDSDDKKALEQIAQIQKRSLSNLIETILSDVVKNNEKTLVYHMYKRGLLTRKIDNEN